MKLKVCLNGLAIAIMASCFLDANATNINKPIKSSRPTLAAPAVEGWYFRAISGYPIAITFEPVVLFKNGEYWEAGGETLESLNITTDKSKHPKAWGTWKKRGATFL